MIEVWKILVRNVIGFFCLEFKMWIEVFLGFVKVRNIFFF